MPYQAPLLLRHAAGYSSAASSTDEPLRAPSGPLGLQVPREPDNADTLDPPPPYSVHDPSSATLDDPPQYSDFDRVAERMRMEVVKAERLRLHCFYGELGCLTSQDVPVSQDAWGNIHEAYMLEITVLRQDRARGSDSDHSGQHSQTPRTHKYTRIIDAVSGRLGLDHDLTSVILLTHANRPEVLRDDIAHMVSAEDWDNLGTQLRMDRMLICDNIKIIDSFFERNFLKLNIDRVVKAYLGKFRYGEHFMLRDAGGVDRMYAGWQRYNRAGS